MDHQTLVTFDGPANATQHLDGWNLETVPRVGDIIDWFGTRYRVERVTHVFKEHPEYDERMDRIVVTTGLAL